MSALNSSMQLNTSGVLVNSFNASSMNNSLSFIMNSMVGGTEEDNAQSILEEHVSRIWDESTGQTPANMTPGRHSPDRLRGSRGHKPSRPGPMNPVVSAASRDHMMSLQSFDSGVCGEDKAGYLSVDSASAVVAAAAASTTTTSSSDSHHKHIHHYHHHHHHIHKDNKAGVPHSQRTNTSGVVTSSSSGMHHMMSAPQLTPYSVAGCKDSAGGGLSAGNKRVPPLPPSLAVASAGVSGKQRVLPDNNSNVDSGIYDLPNLRDPANEK